MLAPLTVAALAKFTKRVAVVIILPEVRVKAVFMFSRVSNVRLLLALFIVSLPKVSGTLLCKVCAAVSVNKATWLPVNWEEVMLFKVTFFLKVTVEAFPARIISPVLDLVKVALPLYTSPPLATLDRLINPVPVLVTLTLPL